MISIPKPTIPEFSSQGGVARTLSGGIFLSVSGLTTFRECPQKYFYSNVRGYRPLVEADHFLQGGLYGAGVQAWLFYRDRRKVLDAISQEFQRRVPDRTLLTEAQQTRLDQISILARRWVVRYMETYPDPAREFRALGTETPFCVPLPKVSDRQHFLVGRLDLPLEENGLLGFMDVKTTSTSDKEKYRKKYNLNDQFLSYAYATHRGFQMKLMGSIKLDVCVKPLIRWDSFEKSARKDPTFWRENLPVSADHADFWAAQAARSADQIAELLDMDRLQNGLPWYWIRHYQNCLGMYESQPCFAYEQCLFGGNPEERFAQREVSVTGDPRLLLVGEEGTGR